MQHHTPVEMKEANGRLASIDILRGIAMALMLLDHTRDFLGSSEIDPRDVSDALLFLTRWVTHFCAPIFVFLAGASAWLVLQRHGELATTRNYLRIRGLWLIVLELTLVRMGWTFDLHLSFILLQVLWALGVGMIILSFLLPLPRFIQGCIGMLIIIGHNLFDHLHADSLGRGSWLWYLIHESHTFTFDSGVRLWVLYPLVPWIGVMVLGYWFAPYLVPKRHGDWFFYSVGFALIVSFAILRFLGIYGDPHEWSAQETLQESLLSFINCEKYPPSFQFLLMTLGPVAFAYPLLIRLPVQVKLVLQTIGRAPLFFYILQIPLVHGVAVGLEVLQHHDSSWLFRGFPLLQKPPTYGLPLTSIYLAWLMVLVLLSVLCRWYNLEKRANRQWWHGLL